MAGQAMTRRRLLHATGVASVGGLAGCLDDGGTGGSDDGSEDGDEETDPEATAGGVEDEPTVGDDTGDRITVSGRFVDTTGSPVTIGEAVSLSARQGLKTTGVDGNGEFSLEVTPGNRYTLHYTQADQYPTDGLPGIYTIDELTPTSDTDMGEVSLPNAYEVDVTVETADSKDVTDDASVSIRSVNDGPRVGFELVKNPVELRGEVRFSASYDGEMTTETVTVTEARSVTVTVP